MKSLNNILFITKVAGNINNYCKDIKASESYEEAKKHANAAFGHLDCCITYLNCMICEENNDFTPQLDDTIEGWFVDVYQALIDIASQTGESSDIILSLCSKRDEHIW